MCLDGCEWWWLYVSFERPWKGETNIENGKHWTGKKIGTVLVPK